jgi:hypothetical protein
MLHEPIMKEESKCMGADKAMWKSRIVAKRSLI